MKAVFKYEKAKTIQSKSSLYDTNDFFRLFLSRFFCTDYTTTDGGCSTFTRVSIYVIMCVLEALFFRCPFVDIGVIKFQSHLWIKWLYFFANVRARFSFVCCWFSHSFMRNSCWQMLYIHWNCRQYGGRFICKLWQCSMCVCELFFYIITHPNYTRIIITNSWQHTKQNKAISNDADYIFFSISFATQASFSSYKRSQCLFSLVWAMTKNSNNDHNERY